MCGINGLVNIHTADRLKLIERMNNRIIHRGPDMQAVIEFPNCLLGHVRLSIIDLVSGGQPMQSHDQEISIVFNGEIYGFEKIKQEYKDYPFKTNSDTELLLAMYLKHGEKMLDYLPGMFSFAIWDNRSQKLFCARDRFGEKPFFYSMLNSGGFVFSSEIKGILESGLVPKKIAKESLGFYLKHLYVSPQKTIFENISVLPPAHFMTIIDGVVQVNRYWEIPSTQEGISLSDGAEKFQYLFNQSVKQQLVSDAPIGAFLSGGFDSSLVVSVASDLKPSISTFSFGFDDQLNELPFAKIVAERYQTNHFEKRQNERNIAELMIEMSKVFDEPFADSSNIPTYLISKEAAKTHKVILTGDGGDELMGGYSFWYKNLVGIEQFKASNNYILNSYFLARVANKFKYPQLSEYQRKSYLVKKYGVNISNIHENQNTYFTESEISDLGLKDGVSKFDYSFDFENNLNDAMKMDIENYMPGDILVKTDRTSMANSIELRAPFLDKDLAEFLIGVPYNLKLNSREEKLIAKYAFPNLPKEITSRKKQGFGAPVERWLQIKEVADLKDSILSKRDSKIFDFLDYDAVQQYVKQGDYKTWILLTLALWFESNL
jgi:asparagine synthase (glutamine-hydrolysing)